MKFLLRGKHFYYESVSVKLNLLLDYQKDNNNNDNSGILENQFCLEKASVHIKGFQSSYWERSMYVFMYTCVCVMSVHVGAPKRVIYVSDTEAH